MSIFRSSKLSSANNILLTFVVFVGVLAIVPLLTQSLLLHAPEYDELLHIMAARGVNLSGSPVIEQGLYPRAELYTHLVAQMTESRESGSNDELLSGRLPALVFGMLLAAIVAAWVTRKAGWLAGFSTGLVLSIAPITLHLSVLVRFYTLHALLVTVMLLVLYELSIRGRSWITRILGVGILAALFLLAHHLHVLTELTAGAGVVGLIGVLIFDRQKSFMPLVRRFPVITIMLLIAMAIGGLVLIDQFGIIELLRGSTPAWSVDRANYYGFYLGAFGFHMPFIWPLFPILAVLALVSHPRIVIFCLLIFVTGLVANSIASQKAMRYVYHVFPMFCIVWGIGLYKAVDIFSRMIRRNSAVNYFVALLFVLFIFAISAINTHEIKRALKLVSGKGQLDEALPVMNEPDWVASRESLNEFLTNDETLIVNSGVKSLFAFGRYSYELNRNVVDETDTGDQFGIDERTGRQVISSAAAVEQVLNKPGTELVVLENRMLNTANSVSTEVVDLIESRCESVPLPEATRLSAWRCL